MCLQKLLLGEEWSLIWLEVFVRCRLDELLAGAPALWMFWRLSVDDLLLLPLDHALLGVSYQGADSLQPEVEILELRLHDHLNRFQLVHDAQAPMRYAMIIRYIKRLLLWVIEMSFIDNWGRGILQAKLRGVLWHLELHFVLNLARCSFRLDISDAWLKVWWSLYPISQESLVASEWIEVIAKLGMGLGWRK